MTLTEITNELEINDRVTTKDHKEKFPKEVKCRLLNPAKSLNQWRGTDEALEWFSNINKKKQQVRLQLEIVDFYPSIIEDLFNKPLDFTSTICTISDDKRNILKNAIKSLLFSDGATWLKKNKTDLHDVTIDNA